MSFLPRDNPVWRFVKTNAIAVSFGASAFLILGGFLWAFFALRKISQPLIIHFSAYAGINQTGNLSDLLRFALLGLTAAGINFLIAREFERKDWFLGKLAAAATLLFGILMFWGFRVIIGVNHP